MPDVDGFDHQKGGPRSRIMVGGPFVVITDMCLLEMDGRDCRRRQSAASRTPAARCVRGYSRPGIGIMKGTLGNADALPFSGLEDHMRLS